MLEGLFAHRYCFALHVAKRYRPQSKKNEENQIFEPTLTFDNNEDVVDFVKNGNKFDCLDNDTQFFENIDFDDNSNISSALIEKLKSNSGDNDGLMLFNEGTVEAL